LVDLLVDLCFLLENELMISSPFCSIPDSSLTQMTPNICHWYFSVTYRGEDTLSRVSKDLPP